MTSKRGSDPTPSWEPQKSSAVSGQDGENPSCEGTGVHVFYTGPDTDKATADGVHVDFVIVPGMFHDPKGRAFASPGSGSSQWVEDYVKTAAFLGTNSRILFFDYDALHLLSGEKSSQAIGEIALELLEGLCARRHGNLKNRIMVFLSHDLGGVIAKHALATAAHHIGKWPCVSAAGRVLVCYGTPQRSQDHVDMENCLGQFFFSTWARGPFGLDSLAPFVTIPRLATAVMETNRIFDGLEVPTRIALLSIFAADDGGNTGISPVFGPFHATSGLSFEWPIENAVKDEYPSLIATLEDACKEIWASLSAESYIQTFVQNPALTVPPNPALRVAVPRASALANRSEFQTWLAHPGPQILLVRGVRGTRDALEQLYVHLKSRDVNSTLRRSSVGYYLFDDHYKGRSTSEGMLSKFLLDMISMISVADPFLRSLVYHQSLEGGWTTCDLVTWLEFLRFCHGHQHFLVINQFDNCPEVFKNWLLKDFMRHFENYPGGLSIKMIIASSEGGTLEELVPSSCLTILDLDQSGALTLEETFVACHMKSMMRLRPDLRLSSQVVKDQLEYVSQFDPLVQRIICEQLMVRDGWPALVSVRDIFESRSLLTTQESEDDPILSILDQLCQGVSDKCSFRLILTLLLYSLRPLALSEFEMVTLSDELETQPRWPTTASNRFMEIISLSLAGLVEVVQNEVRIVHPRVRKAMMSWYVQLKQTERPTYPSDSFDQTAHDEILAVCLSCLGDDLMQSRLSELFQAQGSSEPLICTNRDGFHCYALEAWTYHIQHGSPEAKVRFIETTMNPPLQKILAWSHWMQTTPAPRTKACPQTLFPAFASFGFQDIPIPMDQDELFLGLVGAASNGAWGAVNWILGQSQRELPDNVLLDALVAAGSAGDEETMLGIVEHIVDRSNEVSKISWPPFLINRAAWLGLDRFAERYLTLGCSPDPFSPSELEFKQSPLIQAVISGNAKVVKLLLKNGANIQYKGLIGRTALHWAVAMNKIDVLEILITHPKADTWSTDDQGLNSLSLACHLGRPAAVRLLLDPKSDRALLKHGEPLFIQFSPQPETPQEAYLQCLKPLLASKVELDSCVSAQSLLQAALNGWSDVCRVLLQAGVDPNNDQINPPILIQLFEAWRPKETHAIVDILSLLLQNGADANGEDRSTGNRPLISAIRLRSHDTTLPALCSLLLDYGANPSADSYLPTRYTALHYAAQEGNCEVVDLLLDRGAWPNARSTNGFTPLYVSVPYPKVVRMLLRNGADQNLQAKEGDTPLMKAAETGQISTLECLLEYSPALESELDVPGDLFNGYTALNLSLSFGQFEAFELLAEHGADLNHRSRSQTRPCIIHHAATQGRFHYMLPFLPRVEIDKPNNDGESAMSLTSIDLKTLKQLVNAGGNVNYHSPGSGWTPLSAAACTRDPAKVQYLLYHGADVNHTDEYIITALHQACRYGNIETVKLLIKRGADPNISLPYSFEGTALHAACQPLRLPSDSSGDYTDLQREILEYLLSDIDMDINCKGGLVSYPINCAILRHNSTFRLVEFLLAKGARVDLADDFGRLPIHFSSFFGLGAFRDIFDAGGDIHSLDSFGRSTLHWAANSGSAEVAEFLLSLLPPESINVKDIDGWTPLCYAAASTHVKEEGENAKLVRLLLKHGADPKVKATMGTESWSAVRIAMFFGKSSRVIDLLEDGLTGRRSQAATNTSMIDGRGESGGPLELKQQKRGFEHYQYCDGCPNTIRGMRFACKVCKWYHLCTKCHRHCRDIFNHPEDHEFEQRGPEFAEEDSEAEGSGSEEDSDSSMSSSTGSSLAGGEFGEY